MKPTKQELLERYADKPVQRFYQVDGWTVGVEHGDAVMHPDADGDCFSLGPTFELMRSPGRDLPVRVLIHEDAKPEDVRRLLEKTLDSLDDCFRLLREEIERDLLARAGIASESPF